MTPVKNLAVKNNLYSLPCNHFKCLVNKQSKFPNNVAPKMIMILELNLILRQSEKN